MENNKNPLSGCRIGEYLSIYLKPLNEGKFTFGSLLCVDKDFYALQAFDRDGSDDGIHITQGKRVARIEKDGLYSQKMQQLITAQKEKTEYKIADGQEDMVGFFLNLAKERQWIVSIELLESGYDDVTGFVGCLENGLCTILQVDQYGKSDGESFFSSADITAVACNTEDEKIIRTLWELSNHSGEAQ